jgi:hypothetical protein
MAELKQPGARLKIHCPELVGYGASIELEGVDISHCVQGIELSLACDDATRATIKILVRELDVTAETLALLQAHVCKPEREPVDG